MECVVGTLVNSPWKEAARCRGCPNVNQPACFYQSSCHHGQLCLFQITNLGLENNSRNDCFSHLCKNLFIRAQAGCLLRYFFPPIQLSHTGTLLKHLHGEYMASEPHANSLIISKNLQPNILKQVNYSYYKIKYHVKFKQSRPKWGDSASC